MGMPSSADPSERRRSRTLSPRVLFVEDEPSLSLTLSDRLKAEGYGVEPFDNGEAALARAEEAPFDVAILDVMLPGIDGFEVCRRLRARGIGFPVIMLTARSQVVDKVVGLKLGADDYLTKPFEMIELLARLEALLRRSATGNVGEGQSAFGDLRVDSRRAEVTRNGEPVPLSAMEYRLLLCFLSHRGETLSREKLLEEVWDYDASVFTRTVDVHVASLRQKIEPNPSHPRFIVTVHRLGYRFDG
jgi:two-component system alkaline phosphatase synthesis response regulator PhoP